MFCIPILVVPRTTILKDDNPTNGHIHAPNLEDVANGLDSIDSNKQQPTSKAVPTTLVMMCGLLNYIVVFVQIFLVSGE